MRSQVNSNRPRLSTSRLMPLFFMRPNGPISVEMMSWIFPLLVVEENHILPEGLAADVQLIGGEFRVGIANCQAAQDRQFGRDSELRGQSPDIPRSRLRRSYPVLVRSRPTATFAGTSRRWGRRPGRGPGACRQCRQVPRGRTLSCAGPRLAGVEYEAADVAPRRAARRRGGPGTLRTRIPYATAGYWKFDSASWANARASSAGSRGTGWRKNSRVEWRILTASSRSSMIASPSSGKSR